MSNLLSKPKFLTYGLPVAVTLLFAMKAWSITPLDEKDMDGVSAETSSFILDIYGAAAAGLAIESEEDQLENVTFEANSTAYNHGEEAEPAANQKLETIEKQASTTTTTLIDVTSLDAALVSEVIEASTYLVQQSESFDTTKQIRFRPNGHHHESHVLSKDSVKVTRDLNVELLEFQHLRHDEAGDGGFGNLYLSDWNSRGNSTISIVE